MTQLWSPREYRDGDEKGILELYKSVFGNDVNPRTWEWQYRQNPAGQPVIVIAESNRGIVGHYALIPLRMKIGEKKCTGSLSLDTMVHPDYWRQGILVTLAKQAYGIASKKGIDFIYGFPNKNSHYALINKLNWVDLHSGGIPLWVKPLNFESIIRKRYINNRLMARWGGKVSKTTVGLIDRLRSSKPTSSIQKITSLDHRFDSLWSKAARHYNILAERDTDYLSWRYMEKPDADYTIFIATEGESLSGYIVLKCMQRFDLQIGFIVDMLTASERTEVGRDLISQALKFFELKEMDIVNCLMMPNASYASNLREAGFIKAPRRLLPQVMFLGVCSFVSQNAPVSLAEPSNWFITWGDHDDI